MSLWDKADKVERVYLKLIVRKFRSIQRKVATLDEINILQSVSILYEEIDKLCREGFKKILADYGDEMFDLWLLDQYDPVTKYKWSSELERKRSRLFDTLMADMVGKKPRSVINHDIEVAMRYMERQFRQTGDDVLAQYLLSDYQENGAQYVMWVTAKDEKVCEECAPRDGKRYRIEDCPQWPAHYNCRCEVIPVVDIK